MPHADVVIIGAGQAGLAMSRCLSDRGIEHVVLERGRVAERWRSERWESLQLLTPNWQTRLPGFRYDGPDPDGYMNMPQLIAFLERYASISSAPVETGTAVHEVAGARGGFCVRTNRGSWHAHAVVMATGYNDVPYVPRFASSLSSSIVQVVPPRYRRPSDLPDGGVLVVGASATAIQLADEIHASGRPVSLAVGRHMRMPRLYRGRDILWWLDTMGLLSETIDRVYDSRVSRAQPSFQLVGRADRSSLDLAILRRRGVRMLGHAVGADGARLHFEDDYIATTVSSDAKLALLLRRIDAFIAAGQSGVEAGAPERFDPYWPDAIAPTPTSLDLRAEGIRSVVWATGFRRTYPWLRVPVLDGRGEIRHRAGVTPHPGLYALGLHFQCRRNSAFIDGVGNDAADLARDIARRLARPAALSAGEALHAAC